MARAVILASGKGSNFEAVARALPPAGHTAAGLIYDRRRAGAADRAARLGIPSWHISYYQRSREEAEAALDGRLRQLRPDLIVLSGFMRILSPPFVRRWKDRLINIHPSLLPRYPGTEAVRRSFESGDDRLGITIHRVDEGVDTGPILLQRSFLRREVQTLEEAEARIHAMEHRWYPETVLRLLSAAGEELSEESCNNADLSDTDRGGFS